MVNVYVFDISSMCFHGKELLRKCTLHQKYRKQSHNETDVWHVWKVDSRTIRWDYGVNTIDWVDSSWKHFSLVMKKSSISCTQRSTYSQILYYVLERWTRTDSQTLHGKTDSSGSKVLVNTELWTELMVSQWNSSGISSQDSPHWSSAPKSKSYC